MTETAEKTTHAWWASPRFLLSAAAVILLVFIGIVLFLTTGNDDDAPAEASPPSQPAEPGQTPTPAATGDGAQESVCGLDATGGVTLTTAPDDIEWEFLKVLHAPKSKDHGPGVVDPNTGVRSCFSHTPEGAVLAVAGFFAAGGDAQLFLDTVEKQVIDGPAKEKNLALLQQLAEEGEVSTPPIEIEGFRLLSYNEIEASVEVVLGADAGQERYYQTQSADILWRDGDWYFHMNDDGSTGSISGQITNLTGYIPWGPDHV